MNMPIDRTAEYLADPRATEDLVRLAAANDPDNDEEAYWNPIRVLEHRLPRIFDEMQRLSEENDPKLRSVAATVVGQHAVKEKWMGSQCVDLLLDLLQREQDVVVITAMINALGQFHDPRVIPRLLAFKTHPDATLRFGVTQSLARYEDVRAIDALIDLSTDVDREVRNWATFNLGSMIEVDTPAIRQALKHRLTETDDEIRGEALVGLVIRGDHEIIPALLQELERHKPEVLQDSFTIGEIADRLIDYALAGDTRWSPVLKKLQQLGIGDTERLHSASGMLGQDEDGTSAESE
ncbi:MAG: hypothetical protein JWM68_1574 [Verrucomicrobiales bacterium]|nr:hypothetical protein [Verrucomicrobiales bacterium]